MCWDIPLDVPGSWGGLSTVGLGEGDWTVEIPLLELKPGDALGLLGRGSQGPNGGAAVMFERWHSDDVRTNTAITWEMLPDAGLGPVRRARPVDSSWHGYRYRDIVD